MQRHRPRSGARRPLLTTSRVGLALAVAFTVWVGSAFASKLWLAYRLNSEVHRLQRQNQSLTDANRAYQQQLDGISQPGGEEEILRQHGYSAPGETVYVVSHPSPAPSASPRR